nr:type II toxin-antitoxin system RelE/ParE family toxin [Pseudanabaena mucicola]
MWNVYYDSNSNQLLSLRLKLCNHWGLIGTSYSIDFTSEAIADLAKIARTNQIRIARKIKWLGENFEQITPLSLSGNLSSFFKLRVGDYRVIYAIAQSQKSIIIHQVGHRSEIYD